MDTDEFTKVSQWLATLRANLDLEGLEDPDFQDMLDTVRDAAHSVLHAAGPVAAFAAGYAVARAGGSADDSARVLAAIRDAVAAHE